MSRYDTLIRAGWVLTQNPQRLFFEHALLGIKAGKIACIKKAGEGEELHADNLLDLGHCLVLPGLINAHTHAAMVLFRGIADDLPLMGWLEKYIFPLEKTLTDEIVYLASLLACAEMLASGTTAFQDMYLFAHSVCKAVDQSGMKARIGEGIFSFPSPAYPDEAAAFALLKQLYQDWRGHPRIKLAVMPHSAYTVTPRLLAKSRDFALSHDMPLHFHLAETTEETDICLQRYGVRPVEHFRELGILGKASAAHCVQVNQEECAILAQHETVAVHNPSSNMKLGSGTAPLSTLLQHGVVMALGTDGAASNNSLNMFLEMRTCALLQKVYHQNPSVMPAQMVLDMATLGGAKALQWNGLGSLQENGPADLIALDLRPPHMQPLHNPLSQVVYAASGHEVYLSMVNGEILYREGKFKTFDVLLLQQEIKKIIRWIRKKQQ